MLIYFVTFIIGLEPFADQKVNKEYSILKKDDIISIDGLMVEDVWKTLKPIDDFTQDYPDNGAVASLKTEIRMFYDDKGIYIYARMHDDMPDQIQKRLSRRDDLENGFFDSSDWIMFQFDSRHDHQTGYLFAVNCSGVKADAALFADQYKIDLNHNSLWYAETKIDHLGWTAELFLPFSSFRFDSSNSSTWGFNSKRYIYRLDETTEWVVFPQEINGRSSQFGHINGFKEIKNNREIYFTPYFGLERSQVKEQTLLLDDSGYPEFKDNFNYSDKFIDNTNLGFNIKCNLESNTALNIAYKPDFGQVEVDPADINISYYETYLEEKRPLFIEDAEMFNLPIQMFYSRRIGEEKNIAYNANIPTYINEAIKLSGKNHYGFSYGLIAAKTSSSNPQNILIEGTNPSDNTYGVFRMRQDIFDGNSFIGFMATKFNGIRGNYSKIENENNSYSRNETKQASTYSIDGVFNYFENRFSMDFQFAQTEIDEKGSAYSIESNYDINRFWSIGFDLENVDENFNNNDIGYIKRNNIVDNKFTIRYQNLNLPFKSKFQEWTSSLNFQKAYTHSDAMCIADLATFRVNMVTKSQHVLDFQFSKFEDTYNDLLLYDYKQQQLGVPIFASSGYKAQVQWESDPRFENTFLIGLSWSENKINDNQYEIVFQHDYKPQFDIRYSFRYNYEKADKKYQWLDIIDQSIPRYIFANADNEKHNFIWRFDAFLSKSFTIQNYTQFIQTNNRYDNWMEFVTDNDNPYPEDTNMAQGIYPIEGENPGAKFPNPNNDPFFLSKYSELIYNLVLQWEINSQSNLYFIYTRYWFVNGKKFNRFMDFLNYSENKEDWVETYFDNGISIKYTHQFNF